jgi:hypothetical protein
VTNINTNISMITKISTHTNMTMVTNIGTGILTAMTMTTLMITRTNTAMITNTFMTTVTSMTMDTLTNTVIATGTRLISMTRSTPQSLIGARRRSALILPRNWRKCSLSKVMN